MLSQMGAEVLLDSHAMQAIACLQALQDAAHWQIYEQGVQPRVMRCASSQHWTLWSV